MPVQLTNTPKYSHCRHYTVQQQYANFKMNLHRNHIYVPGLIN